jgi:hypothetical protein
VKHAGAGQACASASATATAVARAVAKAVAAAFSAATNGCSQAVAASQASAFQEKIARATATASATACSTGERTVVHALTDGCEALLLAFSVSLLQGRGRSDEQPLLDVVVWAAWNAHRVHLSISAAQEAQPLPLRSR